MVNMLTAESVATGSVATAIVTRVPGATLVHHPGEPQQQAADEDRRLVSEAEQALQVDRPGGAPVRRAAAAVRRHPDRPLLVVVARRHPGRDVLDLVRGRQEALRRGRLAGACSIPARTACPRQRPASGCSASISASIRCPNCRRGPRAGSPLPARRPAWQTAAPRLTYRHRDRLRMITSPCQEASFPVGVMAVSGRMPGCVPTAGTWTVLVIFRGQARVGEQVAGPGIVEDLDGAARRRGCRGRRHPVHPGSGTGPDQSRGGDANGGAPRPLTVVAGPRAGHGSCRQADGRQRDRSPDRERRSGGPRRKRSAARPAGRRSAR
jgi:hypothetical protein